VLGQVPVTQPSAPFSVLPTTYEFPGALVLLVGGLIACFAGYRLFRLVLGIYGFILGALAAVSMVPPAGTAATIVTLLVGGVIGAAILTVGYFVGVALLGAGLGILVVHAIWTQFGWAGPFAVPVLAAGVVGAILAVVLQRYAIIVGTAFGGAWSAMVGAVAILGGRAAPRGANAPDTWVTGAFDLQGWLLLAWFVLGILGVLVQLRSPRRRR
jgi:hypothetical protein